MAFSSAPFRASDLFGPTASIIGSGRQIGDAGSVFLFRERPRSGLAAIGEPQWEKVTLTVDSGASDTVVPIAVCPGAELIKTSRVGTEYEIADGSTIENLGEKQCLTKLAVGDASNPMLMSFQVVDVSKALLSVHKITEQGHDVLFSETRGNAILLNGDPKQRIELRHCGGTYELDVWVKPAAGFSRQR